MASDVSPTLASHHRLGEELPPGVESTGTGRTLAVRLSLRRRTMSSRLPSTKPKALSEPQARGRVLPAGGLVFAVRAAWWGLSGSGEGVVLR